MTTPVTLSTPIAPERLCLICGETTPADSPYCPGDCTITAADLLQWQRAILAMAVRAP